MLSKENIFNQIQYLLNTQHFGVLATRGGEYPYCTLVGYATSPDYKEIIFATIRNRTELCVNKNKCFEVHIG